jgi:hypothetical protein
MFVAVRQVKARTPSTEDSLERVALHEIVTISTGLHASCLDSPVGTVVPAVDRQFQTGTDR